MTTAEREARKRQNTAAFWNARQQAARTERELAGVMVDWARTVAGKTAGGDDSHPVWRELAELLHTWASRHTT